MLATDTAFNESWETYLLVIWWVLASRALNVTQRMGRNSLLGFTQREGKPRPLGRRWIGTYWLKKLRTSQACPTLDQ